MNRSIESILRFVNVTTSGLLAGFLGFCEAALMPGGGYELPSRSDRRAADLAIKRYFNAIGPVALGTAGALPPGSPGGRPKESLFRTGTARALRRGVRGRAQL